MTARAIACRTALPLMVLTLSACSITRHSTGLAEDGELTPCPEPPRCVSSQAEDPDKQIAPFELQAHSDASWQRLGEVVNGMERTTVVKRSEYYLHAEVVSPWRFYTDDLELLRTRESNRVHVRSSARVGYYDFNVNRERVDKLRKKLIEAELISGKDETSRK